MIGLVEPLGFGICSLRFKGQAVAAIDESGHANLYKLVHDTFHHYLSGENEVFPAQTGLIHASGVPGGKAMEAITDDDRVLVDETDVMDNRLLDEAQRLTKAGLFVSHEERQSRTSTNSM